MPAKSPARLYGGLDRTTSYSHAHDVEIEFEN